MRVLLHTMVLMTFLLASTATSSLAGDRPMLARDNYMIHGGSANGGKAVVDTVLLMGSTGSGAVHLGDFEAGWNGWTSVDRTQAETSHWQVSDYNQSVPGNLAAWCGTLDLPSCDEFDPAGGYGNDWDEIRIAPDGE